VAIFGKNYEIEDESGVDEVVDGVLVDENNNELNAFTSVALDVINANEKSSTKTKKSKRAFLMTPYQACKLLNSVLWQEDVKKQDGEIKTLNSPYMYIMVSKGKFKVTRSTDGTDRMVIDEESFMLWLHEYVVNAKVRASKYAKAA
jgi:hypothetical protein